MSGRVDLDGREGVSLDVIVPLVLFLCSRERPTITARIIKPKTGMRGKFKINTG